MANIKDLKNNDELVIDTTSGSGSSNTESNSNGGKTVVNLNGIFEQPKGNHSVIMPSNKTQKRVQQSGRVQEKGVTIDMTGNNSDTSKRVDADLSQFPDKTPEEAAYAKEHFVDDPMERMLEGEDSLLGKYLDNKEKELTTAYETVEYNQEKQRLEEEAEMTGDDSELIDFLNGNSKSEEETSTVVVNDDDILSGLDIDEEETINEEEESVSEEIKDLEEVTTEEELDTVEESEDEVVEEITEEDEESTEEVINNIDNVTVEEDNLSELVNETPEIDLEISQVENNVIEDEEDDNKLLNEDDDIEVVEEDNDTEVLEKLKRLATERLKPVSKTLDISSFTVLKKASANTKQFNANPIKAAKWVLMNQESTVFMKEFTGAELEKLREFSSENSVSGLTKRYRMIYDHIDSQKPASFETWLKTTPFSDEDNLFFSIYIASFKGANYIPRDCPDDVHCKETWLTDDIDIMNMVKFENDEAKKKFAKIYQSENSAVSKSGLYVSEIVPISNLVAIAFREPSIYTRIELASLDTEFREKYSTILDYIPYIDTIYYIDQANSTLTPVTHKVFADNAIKTTKSKIQQFAKVLSTLSIDEFGTIRPYVSAVMNRTSGMSYINPECTCPKCGKVVPEVSVSAEELLFTRYQLGALVNTSLN